MKQRDTTTDMAGDVAIDVSRTLADPIRALRDRLGLLVDHLERHVSTSTGPTPYPWRSLQTLRQDLASAYLEATQLSRRLEELAKAVALEPPATFELPAAVEMGLHLASHHVTNAPGAAQTIELLVDLADPPPVRGSLGTFALVVAQLVAVSARSARGAAGSTLSVRVWIDEGVPVVTITDNGAGDGEADDVGAISRQIIEPWGAVLDAASLPQQGCTFEIRFG